MSTTGHPTDTTRQLRIDVTPEEFERRLAAHGHDVEEIRHLWSELASGEGEDRPVTATRDRASERRLAFGPVIAVYLGLLLVVHLVEDGGEEVLKQAVVGVGNQQVPRPVDALPREGVGGRGRGEGH